MSNVRLAFSVLALLLAAAIAPSCGSGSNQGQLQSIAVSPATADAQNYPNGSVPFQATASYVDPEHTVTPYAATWTACSQGSFTSDIVITQAGAAQCSSNAHGTYSISASGFNGPGMASCPVANPCGSTGGCTVIGKAQLTCP